MRRLRSLALAAFPLLLANASTAGHSTRPRPPARTIAFACKPATIKTLCGWTIAWETKPATTFGAEGGAAGGAEGSVEIANSASAVGYLDRKVELGGAHDLKLVHFSAEVRPDAVVGKGAGLTLTFLDDSGTLLASHDMGYGDYGMAQGSGGWRKLEPPLPTQSSRSRGSFSTEAARRAFAMSAWR